MKKLLLIIFIYLLATLCTAIFIIARFNTLPEFIMNKEIMQEEDKGIYGDLYYLCRVDYFKIEVPPPSENFQNSSKNNSFYNADIQIFGDSYFNGSRVLKNFPEILQDSLRLKVRFDFESNPLKTLEKENIDKNKRKIFIYEATERRILEDFKSILKPYSDERLFFSNLLKSINPLNLELKYLYLLQNSILTNKIYTLVINFKFNLFGLISDLTPVYSYNPPFLFYYQNVNNKNTSFYYKYSESEIDNVANNIENLAKELKEKYNYEFIFMPIPSSYTINHNLINNDNYNNFLPVLYHELEERNIKYVDLYNPYINSKEQLYYQTDTHWNEKGMILAYDELIKTLKKYNLY